MLQFSAARLLAPRLDENGSYTFVVGDGAFDKRSALGTLNLKAIQGLATAVRHESLPCRVNKIRVGVEMEPADEDAFLQGVGELAAGVAAAGDDAYACDNEACLASLRKQFPARTDLLAADDDEPQAQAA